MQRLILLAAALLWLTVPVLAQAQSPSSWTKKARRGDSKRTNEPLSTRPAEPLPSKDLARDIPVQSLRIDAENGGVLSDSLSEEQILRRLSRLYQYQAEIMEAEATGDSERAEQVLELAMTDLGLLARQPNIESLPRYRELYRTIVTEYEKYYGVSDSLLAIPRGDIFQFRADMFAELEEVDEPLLEDVMLPELPRMETSFPMTMNRLVESSIKYLVRNPDKHINNWMSRADTYFPMIEQIFKEEGVPEELKYLAMIESGLVPHARSWAQAGGMWQFIVPTGSAYGLKVNAWVDERMDPEKATRAAARHLRDLYQQYGQDWQLAIAGYNCSPRGIKRAMQRAGGGSHLTFWDIYPYLPNETRGYVPMFIAAALVASNPEAFGLRQPPPGPRYAYDMVPVQGMISLADAARLAGTTEATLKALNPALRRDATPPSDDPYMLRIPLGSYQRFAEALSQLPPSETRPIEEHVVRKGESLGKIAAKYGVSLAALKSANGLRSGTIHSGQRLTIPVTGYVSSATLANLDPVTVEYGDRTVRRIEPLSSTSLASGRTSRSDDYPVRRASNTTVGEGATDTSDEVTSEPRQSERTEKAPDTRIVYKVRRGDSLGKIASKYGVSVSQIKSWNKLRRNTIVPGQNLKLYPSGGSVSQASSQPERIVYKVRRGDSLGKIASKYGVSVASLKEWNKIRGNQINAGQRLTIYPGSGGSVAKVSSPSKPKYQTYKVRRGDSLGKIASKYGVSVTKLKQWNGLRRNTIVPGQRLKIYR